MGKPVNRVLFVNSEIMPFLPETPISKIGRCLPQGIQERKKEIRAFMPRYGCINERKNQLHEVIRLSGMNIILIFSGSACVSFKYAERLSVNV